MLVQLVQQFAEPDFNIIKLLDDELRFVERLNFVEKVQLRNLEEVVAQIPHLFLNVNPLLLGYFSQFKGHSVGERIHFDFSLKLLCCFVMQTTFGFKVVDNFDQLPARHVKFDVEVIFFVEVGNVNQRDGLLLHF